MASPPSQAPLVQRLRVAFKHYVSEDCWFTCPAATEAVEGDEACGPQREGKCSCGADSRNAERTEAALAIEELVAALDASHASRRMVDSDAWRYAEELSRAVLAKHRIPSVPNSPNDEQQATQKERDDAR